MIPAIIIVGGHLAVAVADRLPVMNFELTCREETQKQPNDKLEVCIADEKRARDQLTAQWSSFDPAARTRCARESTSSHTASYLELLVCLELDQADREVRGSASRTTITEPERGERDEAPDASPSRPAPVAAPSVAAPSVAAPSRPAPVPRSPQQPVARSAGAPPATPAPPAAAPLPLSPSPPESEPQPPSQAEVLQQSLCRSPLGYVIPSCR